MASDIRIKRSGVTSAPSSLKSGELAYSWANGVEKLFFGRGDDGSGNATSIVAIGGQYFTDMLDQTAGVLTASSAIIVDANKKIDDLLVDNLELNGNTLSTTNTNGSLVLDPNGSGLVSIANAYTLPRIDGSTGYVLTTNGAGTVSWAASSSILSVAGDSGTAQEINLLTETLTVSGTGAISTAMSTNKVTVSVATATDTVIGVASFNAVDFIVSSGAVSLNTEAVQDIIGAMVSSNTESGIAVTYDDANGKLDFDVGDFSLTITGDVDGTATVTNLGNTTINVVLDTVNTDTGQFGSSTSVPVITVNGKGLVTAVTTATISTSFTIAAETGTSQTFNNGSTLTFAAGEGIDTVVTANTITISGEDATTTNKGIASFATGDFDVNSGAVSLKGTVVKSVTTDSGVLTPSGNSFSILGGEGMDVTHSGTSITVAAELATAANVVGNANIGAAAFNSATFDVTSGFVSVKANGISNAQLANSSVTVGSTSIALGATSTSIAGLTELTVDNLNFNGNAITATDANGSITLDPNGTGSVDVSGSRITNVATPVNNTDAANKLYVDNAVAGLTWKDSVNLLVSTNIALTGTDLTIDSHPVLTPTHGNGYRVLLTGQTDKAENGIYDIAVSDTPATNTYTLTRSSDADTYQELIGISVFVMEGTTYANTSWVQSNHYLTDFGHTGVYQSWVQFSGAGAYTAGDGLGQTGTTFYVQVAANGGIELVSDALQLKSTVAGNGLTLTSGVLAVVGTTDRISVSADAIDIASTYVGQTSITTLGTIGTGTWQGSVIGVAYGGSGLSAVTARAVTYGNGSSALGVTGVSAIDGSFLREDATGNPYWSNVVDGGTF